MDEALPRLSQLTSLAFDRCGLAELPRQLSRLTQLRLLSFCDPQDPHTFDQASSYICTAPQASAGAPAPVHSC